MRFPWGEGGGKAQSVKLRVYCWFFFPHLWGKCPEGAKGALSVLFRPRRVNFVSDRDNFVDLPTEDHVEAEALAALNLNTVDGRVDDRKLADDGVEPVGDIHSYEFRLLARAGNRDFQREHGLPAFGHFEFLFRLLYDTKVYLIGFKVNT